MKRLFIVTLVGLLLAGRAFTAEGTLVTESPHDARATADRFVELLQARGLTLFARIDHAAGAEKSGQTLLPTEVIIFGNPKIGTPLMKCARTVALDLPQKALVWTDAAGKTWLAYNDPAYLHERHDLCGCEEVLAKAGKALAALVAATIAD